MSKTSRHALFACATLVACDALDDVVTIHTEQSHPSPPFSSAAAPSAAGESGQSGAPQSLPDACESRIELCNGLDDNCNEQIDEDFRDGVQPLDAICIVGVGACERTGTFVCSADGRGTECSVSPGQPNAESCNSVDDDCDGLVDYSVDGGRPESACQCDALPLVAETALVDPGETATMSSSCQATGDGTYSMAFTLGACAQGPWAQCIFKSVDLNRFDADHGAHDILAVHFCNDAVLHTNISVYYGDYPRRKRLDLLSIAERIDGLAASCHTRYFLPADAICPTFAEPPEGLPAACASGCKNGRWTDESADCNFDYAATPWWLTAEFCAADMNDEVTLHDVTLRLLEGSACTCASDADCLDLNRPFCDRSSSIPNAACTVEAPRCGGVCVGGQ